jgi:hypothetical protein
MKLMLPRIGVAALVAIALAACSGQSTLPSAAPQSIAPAVATGHLSLNPAGFDALSALSPDAKSPCDIGGFWYFKGSCILTAMPSAAGKIALSAYKGLAVTLAFAKSNGDNTPFVVDAGTSSKDITGTFQKTKFPDYGSVGCYNPTSGKTTKCVGTGFLYELVANASKTATVDLKSLPSAAITTTGTFPGTKSCAMNALAFTSSGIPAGWYVLSSGTKPKGTTLSLPVVKLPFTFKPQNFTVFAYSCE